VSKNVSDQAAVFCELLAAALQIQEQVQIHPSDRILVIGAGRLGQLIAQTLALTPAGLWVVARHAPQHQLLAQRSIPSLSEDQVQPGEWDIVVEVTGSAGGFQLARQAVRPRGLIVLKSTYAGDIQADFSSLVVDEITLVGSRCGPFLPALRLLAAGRVDPIPLIEGTYPLSDGLLAFERAAQPGVSKVLLAP
jgi:threonine dehydrogenase-like Zn-dependent dehydrogenase